jgi:hypothetical protein
MIIRCSIGFEVESEQICVDSLSEKCTQSDMALAIFREITGRLRTWAIAQREALTKTPFLRFPRRIIVLSSQAGTRVDEAQVLPSKEARDVNAHDLCAREP